MRFGKLNLKWISGKVASPGKRQLDLKVHRKALRSQRRAFIFIKACAVFVLAILFVILSFIIYKGVRYSVIDSTFYSLKEEVHPDNFYILVNAEQKQKKAISWETLAGMFDDYFLTWKQIDGFDVYVSPVMSSTVIEDEAFNKFFFAGREPQWGALVQTVNTTGEAVAMVSETPGAITIISKDDYEQLSASVKQGIKILPVRRYVYVGTPKLTESEDYMGSLPLKNVEQAIKDGLIYETMVTQATIDGVNPVRLTRIKKGWNFTPKFLVTVPDDSGASGGIVTILGNTIFLLLLTLLFAVPLGLMSSIYFVEYAKNAVFLRILRFGTETLAGIPSIIFGLVGSIVFVNMLNLGFGLLSGALTLTFMILPTIVRTSEEAIIAVPNNLREASLGLGATKIQTIFKVVLPTAIPGIVNGVILAMGRALGETAALIFTMGSGLYLAKNLTSSARGLSTHIYLLYAQGISFEKAFATAFVLIVFVLIFNTLSKYTTRKYEWMKK